MTRQRIYCLAAAALTAASLALPLWGFRMTAPQYPDEALQLQITRHGIRGDVQEVETLQQYIGVRFPDELPELAQAQVAIAGLTALLLLAAAVHGRAAWWLRRVVFAVFVAFLLASAVTVQMRLYEAGHTRDPNAPIRAVRNFTPPLVGPVKVGNFTVWSFPHAGAVALLAAAALTLASSRKKPLINADALNPRDDGSRTGSRLGRAVA